MIAVDTSVAVAALAGWHDAHEHARTTAAGALIPAHARLETYSLLTRMPPPHRLSAAVVAELLERWFPAGRILVPSAKLSRNLVRLCNDAAVEGGAVYDALIGLTADEADTTLVTRDQRAALTYRRVGVELRIVR